MPNTKDQEVTLWTHKHIRIIMSMMMVPKVVEVWITATSSRINQRRTNSRQSQTSWMGRIRWTTEHLDLMNTSKKRVLNSSTSGCRRVSHRIHRIRSTLDRGLGREKHRQWARSRSQLCFLIRRSTKSSAAWRLRQSCSQIHTWILLSWRNKH